MIAKGIGIFCLIASFALLYFRVISPETRDYTWIKITIKESFLRYDSPLRNTIIKALTIQSKEYSRYFTIKNTPHNQLSISLKKGLEKELKTNSIIEIEIDKNDAQKLNDNSIVNVMLYGLKTNSKSFFNHEDINNSFGRSTTMPIIFGSILGIIGFLLLFYKQIIRMVESRLGPE